MIVCARQDCEEDFTKKTHNQKYCSDECCRWATNDRLKKNYYVEKDRKNGVERTCSTCNSTRLSRYNPRQICSSCAQAVELKKNSDLISMIMNSSINYLNA